MALTAEQKAKRDGKIGASFVPALMAGTTDRILNEWMRLVDHPDYAEEDFSGNWPVQLGNYLEPFALNWVEKKTGQVLTLRGDWCPHPELEYLGATLDAYRAAEKKVLDVKVMHAYRIIDDSKLYYAGQLVVQRSCISAQKAGLLIVHGGTEVQEHEISWDNEYEQQVFERIKWFWSRVDTLQPPSEIPAVKGNMPAIRVVDMSRSNTWCHEAGIWVANKEAASKFNGAAKNIKGLLDADVGKAFGAGIVATRNRAGAISIKEGHVNG